MEEYTEGFIPYIIYYKPSSDLMLYDISYDELRNRLIEFKINSEKKPISYKEYKEILEMAKNLVIRNTPAFNDFIQDCKK